MGEIVYQALLKAPTLIFRHDFSRVVFYVGPASTCSYAFRNFTHAASMPPDSGSAN